MVPDDSLAARKRASRPANAGGHRGLQYGTKRDYALPARPATPVPTALPPPQAPLRWAGGIARNDGELEPTDTMNPGMNHIYDVQPFLAN